MTRQEQIEIAAQNSNAEALTWSHFIKGAQWADANPAEEIVEAAARFAIDKNKALAQKLAIAVEALRKIEAPDKTPRAEFFDWLNAWRNTTKLMARHALEKIDNTRG